MHTKPTDGRKPAFDATAINDTIQRALAAAGLNTTAGPLQQVTQTIHRALASAGLGTAHATADAAAGAPVDAPVDAPLHAPARVHAHTRSHAGADAPVQAPGTFQTHAFVHRTPTGAHTHSYKLYVPARASAGPRPLLLMLHGCTQSADDFAAGTRMNLRAEQQGCLVLYPEQTAKANASKCWNWFMPQDQQRGGGEPAWLAALVQDVAARHGADPGRVFVAGLSAGAAMAVVLGQAYPDVFAGVGAHSGLPYGSAHDVPSALAAMKGGRSGLAGRPGRRSEPHAPNNPAQRPMPTIVFHGDRDHTVQHSNGAEIFKRACDAAAGGCAAGGSSTDGNAAGALPMVLSTQTGTAPGGRSYSRTIAVQGSGPVQLESWCVHGAGHAWAGGSAQGSYTDSQGPDASAEMLRFFMGLRPATMVKGGPLAA